MLSGWPLKGCNQSRWIIVGPGLRRSCVRRAYQSSDDDQSLSGCNNACLSIQVRCSRSFSNRLYLTNLQSCQPKLQATSIPSTKTSSWSSESESDSESLHVKVTKGQMLFDFGHFSFTVDNLGACTHGISSLLNEGYVEYRPTY